jgi:hypothetical protein
MRLPERVEVSVALSCRTCFTDAFILDQVVESLLNVSYAPRIYRLPRKSAMPFTHSGYNSIQKDLLTS